MVHIRYLHESKNGGDSFYVETIDCHESEWRDLPQSTNDEWLPCFPEPNSPDRLVRATRLSSPDAHDATSHAPILRLATGT
jgi:hypothetical protein